MTSRVKRVVAVMALACAATSAGAAGQAVDEGDRRAAYAIGLWGDLPYSSEQASAGVPNLIADGDLKSGSSRCDDQIYFDSLEYFNQLEAPVAFTPGDNDWTDCDRPAAGGKSRDVFTYQPQIVPANRTAVPQP
jgi:hypothetical protein